MALSIHNAWARGIVIRRSGNSVSFSTRDYSQSPNAEYLADLRETEPQGEACEQSTRTCEQLWLSPKLRQLFTEKC